MHACLLEYVPAGLAEEGGSPGIFLLQQRAPAIQGRQAEWAEDLTEWAQSRGFAQMVVLCGLDPTLRKDKQILGSSARWGSVLTPRKQRPLPTPSSALPLPLPYLNPPPDPPRYLAGQSTELAAAAEALGVQQLEEEFLAVEREAHGLLPPWPVLAASSRRGLPHLMLGCFAAEGDNVPHSMEVASLMLGLLGKLTGQPAGPKDGAPLRMPCSFAALYGRTTGFNAFLG
jgi:proteasome assembly chaperone 2